MRLNSPVPAACAALLISACQYDNQFRNAPESSPHAVLTARAEAAFRDRGPLISHIDDRPASFWRVRERFLVSAGIHELSIVADKEPYEFEPVRFHAVAGHRYEVGYDAGRTAVALWDVSTGAGTLVTRAARRPE